MCVATGEGAIPCVSMQWQDELFHVWVPHHGIIIKASANQEAILRGVRQRAHALKRHVSCGVSRIHEGAACGGCGAPWYAPAESFEPCPWSCPTSGSCGPWMLRRPAPRKASVYHTGQGAVCEGSLRHAVSLAISLSLSVCLNGTGRMASTLSEWDSLTDL